MKVAKYRVGERVTCVSDAGEVLFATTTSCEKVSDSFQYRVVYVPGTTGVYGFLWTEDHLHPYTNTRPATLAERIETLERQFARLVLRVNNPDNYTIIDHEGHISAVRAELLPLDRTDTHA